MAESSKLTSKRSLFFFFFPRWKYHYVNKVTITPEQPERNMKGAFVALHMQMKHERLDSGTILGDDGLDRKKVKRKTPPVNARQGGKSKFDTVLALLSSRSRRWKTPSGVCRDR